MLIKKKNRSQQVSWALAGLMLCGTLSAAIMAQGNQVSSRPVQAGPADTAQQQAGQLSDAFRSASETIMPSVVLIRTFAAAEDGSLSTPAPGSGVPRELQEHPLFRRFMQPGHGRPERSPGIGTGSGVIIDASGLILTNHHVISGGKRVQVRLHDGREFEAHRVLKDPSTDLAVIQLDGVDDLQAARMGNSDDVRIGDWVLAVGAPFGLQQTVTAGIISAKSRGIGITDREEFLQTDAAINPGNSGGPLVNLRGELIGINTAISSTSGGYQGIGFAVPVNLAHWVSESLVRNGHVKRAFLGVGIQPVDSALSRQFGLETVHGALVTEVHGGSPADEAGLRVGDVIAGFDGTVIDQPQRLQRIVERADPGKNHSLEIVRDGTAMTVEIQVAPLTEIAGRRETSNSGNSNPWGLSLEDRNEGSDSSESRLSADGVVVSAIRPESPADRAGLTVSMMLRRIGRTEVKTAAEARAVLRDCAGDETLLLLVELKGHPRFVVLRK